MVGAKNDKKSDSHDFWEVSQAAVYLTGQACTLSARHIEDGLLRIQFNREVAYYARGIVRDIEEGNKAAAEGLKALKDEQVDLNRQSRNAEKYKIGLAAGIIQLIDAPQYFKAGIAGGIYGGFMAAHGMNNIYENASNLKNETSNAQGWTRETYHWAAKQLGYTEAQANIAYGAVDIGMSVRSMVRLVPKQQAWRLFRYLRADLERSWRQTRIGILATDVAADVFTADSMWDEWTK